MRDDVRESGSGNPGTDGGFERSTIPETNGDGHPDRNGGLLTAGAASATATSPPLGQSSGRGPGPDWRRGPAGPGGGRPGQSAYATRDLTSGSIPKNLVFLAWPQILEGLLRIVDQIADLIWAGFLGHRAIAGMGAAQQYTGLAFTARMGMDMAMRAMVSRAMGMGDPALASRVVIHAIAITLMYSGILVGVGILLTEQLLRLIGISEAVIAEGAAYMRVQFISQAAIGMQNLTSHALASSGDTLTPLKATTLSRVIHIFLSPALVFGLAGLPAIGLPGAALSNFIAHMASLGVLGWVLVRGTSRLKLTLRGFRFEAEILKQLLKIGLPASVNGMERAMAQLLILALVAPFGDLMVAAYTLSRRVEMVGQAGSMGLGNATGTIVGQSIGAQKPERAKQTILWGGGFAIAMKTLFVVPIVLFPIAILSVFTRDAELVEIGRNWILIQAVGYIPTGVNMVLNQTFQTAGATFFVMLVTLGSLWGIELPLAYALSHWTDLGALGIAWAMIVPMVLRPFIYVPYLLSGRWLHIKMFH